jgi:hypothetical protein
MIIGYDNFLDENIDIQYPILEKTYETSFSDFGEIPSSKNTL